MSTSILPTAAEQASARIDSILAAAITRNAATINSIEKILNGTQGLTPEAIIDAGGTRYASLLAYLSALKTAANIAVPGTYPSV
jgi:threonine dehydrogenase-like Zn-dependent dehydrogenase